MQKMQFVFLIAFTSLLISTHSLADTDIPDRQTINATVEKLNEYWSADDMQAWAGLFSEDAKFANSWLDKPVEGRVSIKQMASHWPKLENVREWQVIEGNRMVVGWRERAHQKNGKWGGWYRGMSTFVFDDKGQIKDYEGMFNVEAVKAASILYD